MLLLLLELLLLLLLSFFLLLFLKKIFLNLLYFKKNENKTFIIKTLNNKNEIKFLIFIKKINNNLNKTLNNIFKKNRFDINIIH